MDVPLSCECDLIGTLLDVYLSPQRTLLTLWISEGGISTPYVNRKRKKKKEEPK